MLIDAFTVRPAYSTPVSATKKRHRWAMRLASYLSILREQLQSRHHRAASHLYQTQELLTHGLYFFRDRAWRARLQEHPFDHPIGTDQCDQNAGRHGDHVLVGFIAFNRARRSTQARHDRDHKQQR
jgi:hypothetical protein